MKYVIFNFLPIYIDSSSKNENFKILSSNDQKSPELRPQEGFTELLMYQAHAAPRTAGRKWGLSRRGRQLWLWPEFLPHFYLHCGLKLDGKDRLQSHVYKWVVIKRYLRMSMKSSFKSSANKVSFSSSGNMVSWDWSCSEEGREGLWGHNGLSGVGARSPFQPHCTGHTEGFCTSQHSCSPSPGHTWTHLSLEGFMLKMGQYHC